jgi:hypothetical protein
MAYETLQAIVGTAIVDSRFRRNLLSGSQEALSGFRLTAEETAALCSIRAKTFHGFATQLHDWIDPEEMPSLGGVG